MRSEEAHNMAGQEVELVVRGAGLRGFEVGR